MPLSDHYSRFRVAERLLLTGHSHQAWPDCGFAAQQQAWLDAAELVDEKWGPAFEQAEGVRQGFARLLDDECGCIALAPNTHELVVRFLSALDFTARPKLVTTDSEFHTLRRQLDRLEEAGVQIVRVAQQPMATLSERMAAAVDDRTAAVLISAVFFNSARILQNLSALPSRCRLTGALLLVDAYHALNVAPFSVRESGLQDAFVVGGGYKYCQLGEGNCFLRFPKECELRPVVTGWYSEFSALADPKRPGLITYGQGADRFAGATYDPTSHYRGARVFRFFQDEGLDPARLRQISQQQIKLLIDSFDRLNADPAVIRRDTTVPLSEIGGFLALESPRAGELSKALLSRGVWTDARGTVLRFGPAPYLTDAQLVEAIGILGEVSRVL